MKLYGKKALLDNINNNNITKVEILKNCELLSLLKEKNILFEIKQTKYFEELPKNLNHQNIIVYLEDKKEVTIEDICKLENALVLIVDSIQDPYNFGAIIRTANAFGVDAIIYKKDNQVQINDFVIKTSMGGITNVNMIKTTNIVNTINQLKKNKFWIYASALTDNSISYEKIKYDNKSVLIVGNEDKGISKLVLDNSDVIVKIPMFGTVQSLNVSVSTGILLAQIKNAK